MAEGMKITYHYHSGFSVQIDKILLVFDYWEGEGRKLEQVGRLEPTYLRQFEHIYVFISHAHPDHMDPVVFIWQSAGLPISYVVSGDMPVGTRGKRMDVGAEKELCEGLTVKAYPSTDLGVSYYVQAFGWTLFHAGDLNLWHWREESTVREIAAAEQSYSYALNVIAEDNIRPDVVFFPVDPRQGQYYDAGANRFLMTIKPRIFIPMHFFERAEVAQDFARRSRNSFTEVIAMIHPGTVLDLKKEDMRLNARVIDPPKDISYLPLSPDRRLNPSFSGNGSDPFADSDLPVKLE